MFKSILKKVFFISMILTLGQITISQKTLGDYFLTGVGQSTRWAGRQIATAKWMAGVDLPVFIKEWLGLVEKEKPVEKKHSSLMPLPQHLEEEITNKDREAMLKLLKE